MTNAKDSTVDLSHLYPELLVVPSERYEKFYIESISDEWISLYNHDKKEGKLTVEIEVAVYMNLTIQADNVPTNDWDKSTFIGDKVKDVISALSLLSNGEAQYDYCSYE